MPAHQGKFVAYFRVSTDRQGKSGLSLEAQRKSVLDYLDGGPWQLVAEFTEIESGKRSDRPELEKVPRGVKKQKAKLIIAKLDRLSAISHLSTHERDKRAKETRLRGWACRTRTQKCRHKLSL